CPGCALAGVRYAPILARAGRPRPQAAGLELIAAAAARHALADGAETPASGFTGYAAGFLLTTAALHAGGVGAGLAIRRWLAARSHLALGGLGALLGGAGLYLFGQI